MRRVLKKTLLSVLFLGTLLSTLSAEEAKQHPPLVKVESSRCADCHADRLTGRGSQHPPAEDDCTTCHSVEIAEGETRVSLVDADPALCVMCHDDKAAAVEGTLKAPHFPVTESCTTCHDPHSSEHPRLLIDTPPALCTTCHDLVELQPKHGQQLTPGARCTACHAPHGSDNAHLLLGSQLHPPFAKGSCDACHRPPFGDQVRLRARGEALCTACHSDIAGDKSAATGSLHAALKGKSGRAGCLSCHQPHMAGTKPLLNQPSPALCGSCHADVVHQAQAKTGHPPAAEDCLTCHLPHHSEQPRLLNQPRAELCVLCHDAADRELSAKHLGADLARLTCTSCHTPHGTGNPKLLAKTVHPPVLDGCDTCHEGSFDRQIEGGESALCLLCHDDIGDLATKAAVPHPALEVARCADCHNPHASAQEHLVKLPGGGECLACHDDKAAGAGEVAHGVIELIGCRACHEPHGGARPALLRRSPNELCLGCHDPKNAPQPAEGAATARLLDRFDVPAARVRGIATLRLSPGGERNHPVAGHRVLGMPTPEELHRTSTTFSGELSCITCHDPHKGKSRELLRWGAASTVEACTHCHQK